MFLLWVAVHGCLFISEPLPKYLENQNVNYLTSIGRSIFLPLFRHDNSVCVLSDNIHVYRSYLYIPPGVLRGGEGRGWSFFRINVFFVAKARS